MAKKLPPIHPAQLHALTGLSMLNWRTSAQVQEAAGDANRITTRTLRALVKQRLAKCEVKHCEYKPGKWDRVEVFLSTPKGDALRAVAQGGE